EGASGRWMGFPPGRRAGPPAHPPLGPPLGSSVGPPLGSGLGPAPPFVSASRSGGSPVLLVLLVFGVVMVSFQRRRPLHPAALGSTGTGSRPRTPASGSLLPPR